MTSPGTESPPVLAAEAAAALLRTPCLLLAGIEPAALPPGLASMLPGFGVMAVEADRLVLRDAAGRKLHLHHPPALPVAILMAPGAAASVADLVGWCAARDPAGTPPVLAWPAEAEAIPRLLLDRWRDAAAGSLRLQRELRLLRAQDLEMQAGFAALEALVARHGLAPLDLAFENPPAAGAPQPNLLAECGPQGIVQRLPVASAGLSAIALHVAAAPARPEGVLRASLATLEDAAVVAQWAVPLAGLAPGWLALGLERTLAGLPRTLDLTLRCDAAEPPLLSLGGPQPLRSFQVHAAGAPALRRSLALQAWTGLPGLAVPGWASHALPLAAAARAGGLVEVALADLALDAVQALDAASQALVTRIPRSRSIGCHPPALGAITAARLEAACPAAALLVAAGIRLDHPDAADVEFGLAVAAGAAAAREILAATRQPGPGEGWSGWTRLGAQQAGRITAFLAEGAAGPRDIVLATRMADAARQDFAWAHFHAPTLTLPG